ncbi:auxin efflux carrier [Staphylotrichum tortipilum]|uniref:Auxin efflux carrier n=1 Tax=Staphylotrichum tortipilum TaxID=2831512 RepID=A0AAN6RRS3_9PEZI|nr:auxin efflux carrier [Staphylotrichum longicolle]
MRTGLLESFFAAVQASLSVLLVMSYGGLAARLGLIDHSNTKPISRLCARIFLPALLITRVGAELHTGSYQRYVVILVWGVLTHLVSFLVGTLGHHILGFPHYAVVAILINNTTSYPLLLITSLEETGVLGSLILTDKSTKDAIDRAKAYFLVFSTVSNCITFAVGPRVLEEDDEDPSCDETHAPDTPRETTPSDAATEETGLLNSPRLIPSAPPTRRRPCLLLPSPATADQKCDNHAPDHRRPWFVPNQRWIRLTPRTKWWLLFVLDLFNAPLLGALAGAVIGLVPVLHRAFFNRSEDGGVFTAWLTSSLGSVGGLFVSLPVVVAGVTLFCATKEAGENHESALAMPLSTLGFVLGVRFIAWPAVSISVVYLLATRTGVLGQDPMLWFCLMMMPTGPSAMKLITLVQVAGGSGDAERQISKLLTISYIASPILSLTVAGSLLACQAAIRR